MDGLLWPAELAVWVEYLAVGLHGRLAWRFPLMLAGVLFGRGRRTVTSWLRAAGLQDDFRRYYYFLGSLGRNTCQVATRLLRLATDVVMPGKRVLLALDDSPTKRYGPNVEGAGVHHNPTPGPANQKYLYGHVWVTLAWVVRHPAWGTIALPLLASLYVRAKQIPLLPRWYDWKFCTKLQLAAKMVVWAAGVLQRMDKTVWLVADGAYAKRPFLLPVVRAGVVVVSRLRKDAKLFDLPAPLRPGQRRGPGKPRIYGKNRLDLAKRAGHRRGWTTEEFLLYGELVRKTYKTFLATSKLISGVVRVVLVKEEDGWRAYFCTNPNATVQEILEAVADRAALEQVFHDVKEVHGAGQQQLRNIWANVAAFNLTLWLHTLVELWAWRRGQRKLCDRADSPWDDPTRRPSHADRCKALRREMLRAEFSSLHPRRPVSSKIRRFVDRLLALAT